MVEARSETKFTSYSIFEMENAEYQVASACHIAISCPKLTKLRGSIKRKFMRMRKAGANISKLWSESER